MGKHESFAALPGSVLNAVQGRTVRYAGWPDITGTGAAGSGGAVIASGNGAWGALADIVALNDIATDFWICSLLLNGFAPGAGKYDIEISGAAGAPVLAETTVEITAVGGTVNLNNIPFPFPIYMVANAVVQGRSGDSGGGGNIYVGIIFATLL